MTRRILIIAVLAALAPGAARAWAHDEFRIIGTITRGLESEIQVKTQGGKTIAIRLNKETLVTRDKKKVAPTELKAGRSVVVDALGDSEADLLALEVKIVPAIASPRGK